MKTGSLGNSLLAVVVVACLAVALAASAQDVAIVGGTVIDGNGGRGDLRRGGRHPR